MLIGYDGKRAVNNNTGLGNYSRFVIDVMSKAFPDDTLRLYAPKLRPNSRLEPLLERPNVEISTPRGWTGRHFSSIWRSYGITKDLANDKIDLYHGLSNELPLNIHKSGIPSVVTIHDLIWRRIPGDYAPIDRRLYDHKYGKSARNATRIIAISLRTKADLVNDFGIDPDKIDVIYQGCDPQFSAPLSDSQTAEVAKHYHLPERYIIAVGTVQSRKNQLLAVKAMESLPADVKLAIVGRRTKPYSDTIDTYIRRHRLEERVIWLENVPYAHLPHLYKGALISAYPSRYEGFGIPVIESLSAGTPVIAATGSCLEEAGGRGGIYVDPDDTEAFIDAAARLIDNSDLRHKLVADGQKHIEKFSESIFAQATMHVYRKTIEQNLGI